MLENKLFEKVLLNLAHTLSELYVPGVVYESMLHYNASLQVCLYKSNNRGL